MLTTISSPPMRILIIGGSTDKAMAPNIQNRLTMMPVRHSLLSDQSSRSRSRVRAEDIGINP